MKKNENQEKDEKNYRLAISRLTIPAIFSPESLKSVLATSNAIQHFALQNEQVFRQLSAIIDAQTKFINFNSQLRLHPAFEEASAVSKSIERLLTIETSQISRMFEKVAYQSEIWKEQQLAFSKIAEVLQSNDSVWKSHLLEISKFAILSQTSLARIQWEQMGNVLEIHSKMQNSLKKSFWNFSDAYAKLFDSLENQPIAILSFPPTFSKLPAIEFYNGVSIVDSITFSQEADVELEKENKIVIDETKKETDDRLTFLLSELNTELITPLQGARLSLNSVNPDRVRHFSASLRELFTHVLHTLAPDNEVKAWSNLPEYFDKGKPTRKARLLYICRALNQDTFSEFVEKDITSVLTFLQLFQQGTHQVAPRYTDFQLNIMLLRMESTIRFLLEIWRENK